MFELESLLFREVRGRGKNEVVKSSDQNPNLIVGRGGEVSEDVVRKGKEPVYGMMMMSLHYNEFRR